MPEPRPKKQPAQAKVAFKRLAWAIVLALLALIYALAINSSGLL